MHGKSQPYLTTLTPLRGIAALLVVLHHASLMLRSFVPSRYTHFIKSCWIWVDFFFILSGFIMSYVYTSDFKNGMTRKSYRKYLSARFARVYPLHLFTLIWAVVCAIIIVHLSVSLHPFFAGIFNPKAALASVLLIHSLHLFNVVPLNQPSWSLSTEWWVYMVFPLMVPFFSRLKNTGRYVVAVVIIVFYVFLRYWIGPKSGFYPANRPTLNLVQDFGIFRCFAGFSLGMLVYEFYTSNWGHAILKKSRTFVLFFTGCFIGMHFYGVRDIFIVGLFPFVLLAAAYNQTGVKRILDAKILQRLGDLSFSIYMVHMPIVFVFMIFAVKKNPYIYSDYSKFSNRIPDYQQGAIICGAVVILTLLVASLTYRFVEVPARNYLNERFKSKRKETPVNGVESSAVV